MSYCTLEEAWGSNFQNTNSKSISVPTVSKKLAVPTNNLYNSDLDDGATFNGKYYGGKELTRNISNKRSKKKRVKDRHVTFNEVNITSKQDMPKKSRKSLKYINNPDPNIERNKLNRQLVESETQAAKESLNNHNQIANEIALNNNNLQNSIHPNNNNTNFPFPNNNINPPPSDPMNYLQPYNMDDDTYSTLGDNDNVNSNISDQDEYVAGEGDNELHYNNLEVGNNSPTHMNNIIVNNNNDNNTNTNNLVKMDNDSTNTLYSEDQYEDQYEEKARLKNEQESEEQSNNNLLQERLNTDEKLLEDILVRLENLEKKVKYNNGRNSHDVILFVLVGVFLLFILDSVFKIGKLTI